MVLQGNPIGRSMNTIHHQGLELILGAFRIASMSSLYSETSEMPLAQRGQKVAVQYYKKLHSCLNNSAFNSVSQLQYKDLFNQKEKPSNVSAVTWGNIINES